jgi:hypothetical protein
MPETVSVRVTDGDVWVDGEHYTRCDEVDIPAGVYDRLPGSFEQVADSDSSEDDVDEDETDATGGGDESGDIQETDDGGADTVTVDDLDPHPSDLTVDELEERIADVDDVALLDAIRNAETDAENRTTAIEPIDARLNELEE